MSRRAGSYTSMLESEHLFLKLTMQSARLFSCNSTIILGSEKEGLYDEVSCHRYRDIFRTGVLYQEAKFSSCASSLHTPDPPPPPPPFPLILITARPDTQFTPPTRSGKKYQGPIPVTYTSGNTRTGAYSGS